MKTILVIVTLFFTIVAGNAQNLVPNPSFEEHTSCPNNGGQIDYALYWTNPLIGGGSSPDYLNVCGIPAWNVPSNEYGYEPARSGVAYAAIATATNNPNVQAQNNFREYLQVELLDSLSPGVEYCIDFYVSACDSMNFACNNIGVYFSSVEISDTQILLTPSNLKYTPQVENDTSNYIINRVGWTEVSGKYSALGGEKYIIIGNFRDSTTTTSIYTGWTANPSKYFSVHYIDDVRLIQCDSPYSLPLGHLSNNDVNVYPNPVTGPLFIESLAENILQVQLFDSMGRKIFQKTSVEKTITLVELKDKPNDIYFILISTASSTYFSKIVKI